MTIQKKRFLFATWEGGGSVAPALTVARKLAARGHHVRVMSDACNRHESEASGAEFIAWTNAPSRPDRSRDSDIMKDWMAGYGPEGLLRVLDTVWAGPAKAYADDIIAELWRSPADLVVTSEMLFGVAAGCESIQQPYVDLAANVSLFPLPGVPPMGPGFTPARDDEERALHAEVTRQFIGLLDHGLPAVNAARKALGLPALAHLVDQADGAAATLLATSPAFDFAPQSLPAKTHYVGPQLDEPVWAAPLDPALTAAGDLPLVAVSFSTTFQNHAGILQRTVDALGQLPVRGVVTLGDTIAPHEISAPANVRLLHSAPHDRLMQAATVVVTHGGHGTVCRALVQKRPLLVIPHGRDQNDNAVRVTARGAGLSLPQDAGTADIVLALKRLLAEASFAEAAAKLGTAIAEDVARSPVVELLEKLGAQSARPAREPADALPGIEKMRPGSAGPGRTLHQGADGPALDLARFGILELQHVLADDHAFGADNERQRMAQEFEVRRPELVTGGRERSVDQGDAAVLAHRHTIAILGDVALQGVRQHHAERRLVAQHCVVQRRVDALQPRHRVFGRAVRKDVLRVGNAHIQRGFQQQRLDIREIAIGRGARHHCGLRDLLDGGLAALFHQPRGGGQQILAGAMALVGAAAGSGINHAEAVAGSRPCPPRHSRA